jgi:hypothetical protein
MAVNGTGLGTSLANVAGAIRKAARATGASFDYLLATAKAESNLNPNIKAATSSATGLFQFIEQTWLATLKRAGPALGYGRYADAIARTPEGSYTVTDPAMRATVLNLRRDPATNAAMAGAFTQHNSAELRERLGRPASAGELYIAHFLGSTGAAKLITQAANAPSAKAADLFPAAASANRSIFYDRQGAARGVADVYSILAGRFENARVRALDIAGMRRSPITTGAGEPVPDPASTFDAFAIVSAVPVAQGAESGPAFHSLFQTGGKRQPISPLLGTLWGRGGDAVSEVAIPASLRLAPVGAATSNRESVDLRDLYQNGRGSVRGLFNGTS